MAKNKKDTVPHYELLYIVSNKYTEEELKPITQNVTQIIESKGGHITMSENWGKKKFAYPIKHFSHGYYNLVEFDTDAENVKKMNEALRMSSDVLRHQIITKKLKTAAEIKEEKKKVEERAQQKKEKETKQKELEKEKVRGKVDLKELDKKLDKILDTDDLF